MRLSIQTMSDVEESAAMLVQDGLKMTYQNLPQRRPADHAEVFEPSSTMPSMLLTMFYSAALQSGAAESLQSISQPINTYSINQSGMSKAIPFLPTHPGRGIRARYSHSRAARVNTWNMRWTAHALTGLSRIWKDHICLCNTSNSIVSNLPSRSSDEC